MEENLALDVLKYGIRFDYPSHVEYEDAVGTVKIENDGSVSLSSDTFTKTWDRESPFAKSLALADESHASDRILAAVVELWE